MSAQKLGSRDRVNTGSVDSITTELETVAVLCSAVPEINKDLHALTARVDGLDENIEELDSEAGELQGEIEDIGKALQQLTANVVELKETVDEKADNLEERADDLEGRLETLEACFHPDLMDEQQSHVEAGDDTIPFDRGDERNLFIEEITRGPNPTLRGKLDKVQTFVDVNDASEYEEGEVVRTVITDLNGTAAHAAPAKKFEE